jgi:hypothetical protein
MTKDKGNDIDHRFIEDGRGLIISMEQNEIRLVRDEYHEMGISILNLDRVLNSDSELFVKNKDNSTMIYKRNLRGDAFLFGRKIDFINSEFVSTTIENFEVHISAYDKSRYDRLDELREISNTLRTNIPIDETYKIPRNVDIYYDIDSINRGCGSGRGTFIDISVGTDLFEELYRSVEISKIKEFKIWVKLFNAFSQVAQSDTPVSSNFFAPLIEGWGVLHGMVSSFNVVFDDSKIQK